MRIEDSEFQGQRLKLADNSYTRVVFNDCVLVHDGRPATFKQCQFIGCTFDFEGPALGLLQFLSSLYTVPGLDVTVADILAGVVGDPKAAERILGRKI